MARELTNGFPLAAQIPEKFISNVFAKAFLRVMPTLTRTVDGQTLDLWFDSPTARIVPPSNPFENLIEVNLPLTARLSNRPDESGLVFTARPNLIQVEITHGGVDLIAPMVDFRPTAPTAFSVDADVDAYRAPVLTVLRDALKAISPFTAAPLFPDGGRQFFVRNFMTATGTSAAEFLGIFITGEPVVPNLPTTVVAQVGSNGSNALVLVPRDVVDTQIQAGLASNGLGTLPAPLPGQDGYILESLHIELRDGHVYMSGSVSGEDDVDFQAWMYLFANDQTIEVNVVRTTHDGGALFDFLDFFSAGALTRILEEILPRAIENVAGAGFGGAALFARDVPLDRAFTSVRAFGSVGVSPAGLEIPVGLVDTSAPITVAPPYYRAHQLSREFHVSGCQFGDRIKRPRRFPTWQAAIEAGYNGCHTCQRDFNVAAAGDLVVRMARPRTNYVPAQRPVYELTYAGTAKRFGIPIGRLRETEENLRGWLDEETNDVLFAGRMDYLVPGPWTLTITWDGWTVTGAVDVHKRWLNAQGEGQGERTTVETRHGDAAFTVTYE